METFWSMRCRRRQSISFGGLWISRGEQVDTGWMRGGRQAPHMLRGSSHTINSPCSVTLSLVFPLEKNPFLFGYRCSQSCLPLFLQRLCLVGERVYIIFLCKNQYKKTEHKQTDSMCILPVYPTVWRAPCWLF